MFPLDPTCYNQFVEVSASGPKGPRAILVEATLVKRAEELLLLTEDGRAGLVEESEPRWGHVRGKGLGKRRTFMRADREDAMTAIEEGEFTFGEWDRMLSIAAVEDLEREEFQWWLRERFIPPISEQQYDVYFTDEEGLPDPIVVIKVVHDDGTGINLPAASTVKDNPGVVLDFDGKFIGGAQGGASLFVVAGSTADQELPTSTVVQRILVLPLYTTVAYVHRR